MAEEFVPIVEGRATILEPKANRVFYNPIQQFNRDLSVLALKAWASLHRAEMESTGKKRKRNLPTSFMRIHEGLAASGLRSCRYALEIPEAAHIVANDLSSDAVIAIRRNAAHNGVSGKLEAHQGDASEFMLSHRHPAPHAIDLDPYGGAAPFLDAAVQTVADGGILLVTCTDLAVLAGNSYPEKCWSQYGGIPARNDAVHESALRLLLNTVASCAGRYGRAIEPVLSLSIDYYIRVFVRVRSSPKLVKQNIGKSMSVYTCSGCHTSHLQPLGSVNPKPGWAKAVVGTHCSDCGSIFHMAGPMWSQNLHSKEFIAEMQAILPSLDPEIYATKARIEGMLWLAANELNTPFYVSPNSLASIVRSPVPALKTFTSALLNGGYEVSLTHAKPGQVKTNAPPSYIWDVFRTWAAQTRSQKEMKDCPGRHILAKKPEAEVSFEIHPKAMELEEIRKSRLLRFQQNPRADWGPQSRPKSAVASTKLSDQAETS